jgi:hypothetical protein
MTVRDDPDFDAISRKIIRDGRAGAVRIEVARPNRAGLPILGNL